LKGEVMNRREMIVKSSAAALAVGLSNFPLGWIPAADDRKRRVLMYTKSEGFLHSVVQRPGRDRLSLAERIVTQLGKEHNFDVRCTKDGRVFEEPLDQYDGFVFETQGDLTKAGGTGDRQYPPMTHTGKENLLKAVAGGKGFVGSHCASDTFHSRGSGTENQPRDKVDPYIGMVGGEFISHGSQQKAWMRVVDHQFPGFKNLKDFEMLEEWYSLKNFAPNLHVLLVQETKGMHDWQYQRPPYPATWARKHHDGRVFFTSMGHREDVWESKIMQQALLGGLSWALGNVEADVKPNLKEVCPHAATMPRPA
jgi:type 1 glutamine amidotransferase